MQLNERLEKLSNTDTISWTEYKGRVFAASVVESIRIPSTVKRIEIEMFANCRNRTSVEIPRGVEYIREKCFEHSGIREVTLPSTLKEIDEKAFDCSEYLKTVWVEDGCALNVRKYVQWSKKVLHK